MDVTRPSLFTCEGLTCKTRLSYGRFIVIQGGEEHPTMIIIYISDGKVVGTPVVSSKQTGDHEEDEPNGSTAECSDNDSETESSGDMHGDDHEEGLFGNFKSQRKVPGFYLGQIL